MMCPDMLVPVGIEAGHVRHGDKWKEAQAVEDSQYVQLVKDMEAEEGEQWGLNLQHLPQHRR